MPDFTAEQRKNFLEAVKKMEVEQGKLEKMQVTLNQAVDNVKTLGGGLSGKNVAEVKAEAEKLAGRWAIQLGVAEV